MGRDARDLLVNSRSQDGRKPEQVELNDGDFGIPLLKHHCAGRELAALAGRRPAWADATGDWQQWVGRNGRLADADFQLGLRQRSK